MKFIYIYIFIAIISLNLINAQCLSNVSAGIDFSVGKKANGTIWSFGRGQTGGLGSGNSSNRLAITQVGTATNWQYIQAGCFNTFAIKTNGTLWATGSGREGQLGNGLEGFSNLIYSFVQIGSDTNWSKISANTQHTLGLKTDGSLWTWGENTWGQLGDGTQTRHNVPMQMGTDTDWVQIAASTETSLAIKANGTLWAWGINGALGVGDWSYQNSLVPIQVGSDLYCNGFITDWRFVTSGPNTGIVLAIRSNNTLYSFGVTVAGGGGLGHGFAFSGEACVRQIGTDSDWATASCGTDNSYAIKTNGTLWAWGVNNLGQLGDGTTVNKGFPVQIGNDTNWVSVSAGYGRAVALKTDGSLWAWGNNDYGQLGNGTVSTTGSLVPIQVAVAGCALGTEGFELNGNVFKIAPNPTKSQMNLFFNESLNFNNIAVYDVMGRQVLRANIMDYGNSTTINIENLKTGVYVVVLKNNEVAVAQQKLVVE